MSYGHKIDSPQPCVLYCIKKIRNYPELGYAYLTTVNSRGERVLLYDYRTVAGYGEFIQSMVALVPLHCVKIKDALLTFHREQACPCESI